MPPQLPGSQGLRSLTLCLRPATTAATSGLPSFKAATLLPLAQTANLSLRAKKRRMKQDPHGWARAQARKKENLQRREVLKQDRAVEWGNMIHGRPTPFVESFDSAGQAPMSPARTDGEGNVLQEPFPLPTSQHMLNHFLTRAEMDAALEHSYELLKPLPNEEGVVDEEELAKHQERHEKVKEVLERIVTLEHSSARQRLITNTRRCIEVFGRHNTDESLERPEKAPARGVEKEDVPGRAGPDTGSSEVQIAILTAKIRALSKELANPTGHRDKNGKRDLRKMCHKRQRLLRYMERKERGSGRWEHMIETLGLTPATWKQQISF